jgi:hypothetical protein
MSANLGPHSLENNTLELVESVTNTLDHAGIETAIFGGWSEELLGLRPPGSHRDIDLLCHGDNFDLVDAYLMENAIAEEILAKRFTHKRAVLWQGTVVEIILVQNAANQLVTKFFGTFQFVWPLDTFGTRVSVNGRVLPVASVSALQKYRAEHDKIDGAYRQFVAALKRVE